MAAVNEMKESDGNRTEITNHIKSYSILCVCVCEAPLRLFIGFRECRCAPFNENNAHRERVSYRFLVIMSLFDCFHVVKGEKRNAVTRAVNFCTLDAAPLVLP